MSDEIVLTIDFLPLLDVKSKYGMMWRDVNFTIVGNFKIKKIYLESRLKPDDLGREDKEILNCPVFLAQIASVWDTCFYGKLKQTDYFWNQIISAKNIIILNHFNSISNILC